MPPIDVDLRHLFLLPVRRAVFALKQRSQDDMLTKLITKTEATARLVIMRNRRAHIIRKTITVVKTLYRRRRLFDM